MLPLSTEGCPGVTIRWVASLLSVVWTELLLARKYCNKNDKLTPHRCEDVASTYWSHPSVSSLQYENAVHVLTRKWTLGESLFLLSAWNNGCYFAAEALVERIRKACEDDRGIIEDFNDSERKMLAAWAEEKRSKIVWNF